MQGRLHCSPVGDENEFVDETNRGPFILLPGHAQGNGGPATGS